MYIESVRVCYYVLFDAFFYLWLKLMASHFGGTVYNTRKNPFHCTVGIGGFLPKISVNWGQKWKKFLLKGWLTLFSWTFLNTRKIVKIRLVKASFVIEISHVLTRLKCMHSGEISLPILAFFKIEYWQNLPIFEIRNWQKMPILTRFAIFHMLKLINKHRKFSKYC